MKKIIYACLIFFTMTMIFPITIYANDCNTTETTIEYFEDGSYLIIQSETSIMPFAASTKSHTKSANYYNPNGDLAWKIYLTGTFTYTGSSSTCTKATTSYKIYDDRWKVTSSGASKSGNKATGNFTVKKYAIGIPIRTVNKTLTITCSKTGVCS